MDIHSTKLLTRNLSSQILLEFRRNPACGSNLISCVDSKQRSINDLETSFIEILKNVDDLIGVFFRSHELARKPRSNLPHILQEICKSSESKAFKDLAGFFGIDFSRNPVKVLKKSQKIIIQRSTQVFVEVLVRNPPKTYQNCCKKLNMGGHSISPENFLNIPRKITFKNEAPSNNENKIQVSNIIG